MQRLLLGDKDISTSLKFDNEFSVVAFPIYADSIELEYLVIAGGGAGGVRGNITTRAGGGGGAGQVQTGSLTFATGSGTMPVFVGPKGLGDDYDPPSGGRGSAGYDSYLGLYAARLVEAIRGEGGHPIGDVVRFDETGGPSGAGFDGGFNDVYDNAAGGGAGNTSVGVSGNDGPGADPTTAIGGNGGTGTNLSDWYLNSSLDTVGIVAGGGGGSAWNSVNRTAGLGTNGGGNAALNTDTAGNATTFGSGGGGAYEGTSGAGADGLVILRYKNRFKINNSGNEVFQAGEYWYHTYTTASLSEYSFERPETILVSI